MADNVTLPGAGAIVAADEVAGVEFQIVKIDAGGNGVSVPVIGDATLAALPVVPRIKRTRISQTPVVDAAAYAAGDAIGGLLTFANAGRVSGGSGMVESVVIIDKSKTVAGSLALALFDRTFTATATNAPFDPTDADLANLLGIIDITTPKALNDNTAGSVQVALPFVLNGTSLFGQLFSPIGGATPTFVATSDVTVIVSVLSD